MSDAPFRGSLGDVKLNEAVVGMVRDGDGYLMIGADGGIFNFSTLPLSGSLGDKPRFAGRGGGGAATKNVRR